MFGSLGGPELILIFVLALLLFGPRKLPEIGRMLGKAAAEFRKATQDFRTSLEREVELEKIKDSAQTIAGAVREPVTLARGALLDASTGINDANKATAPPPPADAGHHPSD